MKIWREGTWNLDIPLSKLANLWSRITLLVFNLAKDKNVVFKPDTLDFGCLILREQWSYAGLSFQIRHSIQPMT
jgi:hypothetical protein